MQPSTDPTPQPAASDVAIRVAGVSKNFDATKVLADVSLDVHPGEFLALLGGSGCGKTTLLRIIAGLEVPDVGTVAIAGRDLTFAPPYERPVNMMFQSYALFPHLTVTENVAYGLRAAGVARPEREAAVRSALELVQLGAFGPRKPHQLSGGQRQRVALARCLVKKPAVLLLDEPMAALDRGLREDMQRELVRIQREIGTTFVMVTHDQDEAMSMADRIAVMERGRIVQCGAPADLYARPASRFVARFIGRVTLFDGARTVDDGRGESMATPDGPIRFSAAAPMPAGSACVAALRPEHVLITRGPTGCCNEFAGVVEDMAYYGDMTRLVARLASGQRVEATEVNRTGNAADRLERGQAVRVGFDSTAVVVLPA
jgi:putrescine transport system ATP-binding protein